MKVINKLCLRLLEKRDSKLIRKVFDYTFEKLTGFSPYDFNRNEL